MKVLGLLGGMSWESSVEYERLINQAVRERRGGTHSADLIIRSFNFADIAALQASGNWAEAGATLARAAQQLERCGAEAIVLCTNTMHVLAEAIEAELSVPLLHIGDATGQAIVERGIHRVLLLGTRYTMEHGFYATRLTERFGLQVELPAPAERAEIHRIIYEELVRGIISVTSRQYLIEVIRGFAARGGEGVIAGCTEIELLLGPADVPVAYFATTALHSAAAAEFALSDTTPAPDELATPSKPSLSGRQR